MRLPPPECHDGDDCQEYCSDQPEHPRQASLRRFFKTIARLFLRNRVQISDRGYKPVAALRNGLDEAKVLIPISKSLAQHRNVARERTLFDKRIRPYSLDDLVLLEHLPRVGQQYQERIHSLR